MRRPLGPYEVWHGCEAGPRMVQQLNKEGSMRRFILVSICSLVVAASGTGIALAQGGSGGGNGAACPPKSPAGGGDPACGKPRPTPTPTPTPTPEPPACELGPITSAVDAIDFGPLDSTVHDVLCALAENGITI
jgi:hypothetical protein